MLEILIIAFVISILGFIYSRVQLLKAKDSLESCKFSLKVKSEDLDSHKKREKSEEYYELVKKLQQSKKIRVMIKQNKKGRWYFSLYKDCPDGKEDKIASSNYYGFGTLEDCQKEVDNFFSKFTEVDILSEHVDVD